MILVKTIKLLSVSIFLLIASCQVKNPITSQYGKLVISLDFQKNPTSSIMKTTQTISSITIQIENSRNGTNETITLNSSNIRGAYFESGSIQLLAGSGYSILVICYSSSVPIYQGTENNVTVIEGSTPTIVSITVTSIFETGTVIDIDGNVYLTIKIGNQWWMAENLKVTHYRNGDTIPNVTDYSAWSDLTTGACCAYENNEAHVATYGLLYNWYALVDSRNIAPQGWHMATDEEWKALEMYLGMSQSDVDDRAWRGTNEGGKLKATGTTHWNSPNVGATNESGFSALPGGIRQYSGDFDRMGKFAYFWSATEYEYYAWFRFLVNTRSDIDRNYFSKRNGYSVRLIKD